MRFEFRDSDRPGASGSGLAFDRDLDDLRAARREACDSAPDRSPGLAIRTPVIMTTSPWCVRLTDEHRAADGCGQLHESGVSPDLGEIRFADEKIGTVGLHLLR